ncbi:flavin reductase family protein [Motilimonas eburnea]|uniref:flavin reductase family protein n=1 Tax=Motilimonas eburnea TaxID=1737488 RepID=UPI001E64FC82|nr:flavin reductase [Motilimonas eburnea]MCE2570919.1 flavin reductase family protein [Motilimonas eburnea]
MNITSAQLAQFDKHYRTHFVNSLSGYKSANLIGTADSQGNTNLAIVSSVFHLGAHPPLIGMIMRPHRVPRHTLENLLETGYYTINQVNEKIYRQAHQTSARYDKQVSEFAATGLDCEYLDDFIAPYVAQSKLKMGIKLISTQTLAVNGTELVIGEIEQVYVEQQAIQADGHIDITRLEAVAVTGLDSYHTGQPLTRLAYAKPDN